MYRDRRTALIFASGFAGELQTRGRRSRQFLLEILTPRKHPDHHGLEFRDLFIARIPAFEALRRQNLFERSAIHGSMSGSADADAAYSSRRCTPATSRTALLSKLRESGVSSEITTSSVGGRPAAN